MLLPERRGMKKTLLRIAFASMLACPLSLFAETVTLQECRDRALKHNQAIQAAHENVLAAQQNRKASFKRFLPQVGALGGYTYSDQKQMGFELEDNLVLPIMDLSTGRPLSTTNALILPAQKFEFGQNNIYMASVVATQPVFTGGKVMEQYRISRSFEHAAKASYSLETSEVLYRTEDYYWKVVSLKEKVELAHDYRKLLEKLVGDLENLEEEGIISANDLLRARTELCNAEVNVLKAENGYKLAQMALNQVIGSDLRTDTRPLDEFDSTVNVIAEDEWVEKALENRPELKVLDEMVKINESGVRIARSSYMPNVMATASYRTLNPNPNNGLENEFGDNWTVGVTAQIELFHWNKRWNKLSAAKHRERSAELKREESREMVILDVQQAIYRMSESQKRLHMAEIAMQQAQENLRISEDQFGEGLLSSTDLLEAQTLWQKAVSETIDAKADSRLNYTALLKASGCLGASDKGESK